MSRRTPSQRNKLTFYYETCAYDSNLAVDGRIVLSVIFIPTTLIAISILLKKVYSIDVHTRLPIS
ncbi:MAG: hypothetical protein ACQJCO_03535 [cyanobacterium endosymbiont of Rhopalodia sterrenbergii]